MSRLELLVGLLITSCAITWSPAHSTAEAELKQGYSVADARYHFEIDIPVDWRVDAKNTQPGFISISPKDGGKNSPSLLVTAYPIRDLPNSHTQSDFDQREQGIVEDIGHIIDQRKMPMDGCQASAIIFVSFPPQPNKMVVDIDLVRDGMVYAMSFNGTVKQVLHYFPQLSAIAASLHVGRIEGDAAECHLLKP